MQSPPDYLKTTYKLLLTSWTVPGGVENTREAQNGGGLSTEDLAHRIVLWNLNSQVLQQMTKSALDSSLRIVSPKLAKVSFMLGSGLWDQDLELLSLVLGLSLIDVLDNLSMSESLISVSLSQGL